MTPTRRRRVQIAAVSAAGVALACLLGRLTLFVVQADQMAVVFRLGHRAAPPVYRSGLHAKWPWEDVRRFSRRVHLLELEPAERLTSQFEPILVQPLVYWRIADDATCTFFGAVGDEDSARRHLADLVWASFDVHFPAHALSRWLGAGEPVDAPAESALPQTVRQIGWTIRPKAHDLLGIDVLDVGLRRLAPPDRAAASVYRQAVATTDAQTDRIRLMAQIRTAEIKASAKAEADRIIIQAESQAAAIRDDGRAEAEKIFSDARRMNPDLADLMRRIENYRRLVTDNTTIIMTADDILFARPPAASAPMSTHSSQPAR